MWQPDFDKRSRHALERGDRRRQLFSKSFLGYTTYKMALVTREGLLVSIALTILPLFFLWALVKAAASMA